MSVMFSHGRIAMTSLRRNPIRTLLTTLGVIIGVASITLVLSLSEGARHAVVNQIDELDQDVILVEPGVRSAQSVSAYNPYNTAPTSSLTESDFLSVSAIEATDSVAPTMFLHGSVVSQEVATNTTIIATTAELQSILDLELESGQFIDGNTNRDTTVLGENLALQLFGTNRTTGQQVTLKGRQHTVIGILKATNRPLNISGVNLDMAAFVSLEDGKSFNQGVAQIQQLMITLDDPNKTESSIALIRETILKNHRGEEDFSVLNGEEVAASADGLFESVVVVTAIASAVALVVGGIGIMNIMLVTVAERTREIGIRKALGATDQHVMAQFLLESLAMSIFGGALGVALAYALAYPIAAQLAFQPTLNWFVVTVGLGSALIIGVIFGLYPAIKASQKNPIISLRQYQ